MPPCTSRVIRRCDHQVEGAPHLADRVHAVVDAAGAEPVLRGLVAGARLAELVGHRHAHVVVDDLAVVAVLAPDGDAADDVHAGRVACGTMICVMRPLRSPGRPASSVRHMTMKKSARLPFDVNHLWPLITHSSPSRRAVVLQRARVGAGLVGLGHREAGLHPPLDQRDEPLLLLLLGAVLQEDLSGCRSSARRRRRATRRRSRRRAPRSCRRARGS